MNSKSEQSINSWGERKKSTSWGENRPSDGRLYKLLCNSLLGHQILEILIAYENMGFGCALSEVPTLVKFSF
jgi:hypothetical protein